MTTEIKPDTANIQVEVGYFVLTNLIFSENHKLRFGPFPSLGVLQQAFESHMMADAPIDVECPDLTGGTLRTMKHFKPETELEWAEPLPDMSQVMPLSANIDEGKPGIYKVFGKFIKEM